jgi:hypothetical protein
MTLEAFATYQEQAEAARKVGNNSEAGDYYTLACHEALGRSEYVIPPFEDGAVYAAWGLKSLLFASLCYRRAGAMDRCQNRCQHGILICEEIRDITVKSEAQRGMMNEYIGDFRHLGTIEGATDAYNAAYEQYQAFDDVFDSVEWQAEPEFELNMTFFLQFVDAVGHEIDRRTKDEIRELLVARIEYKREHFADLVARISD